MGALIHPGHEEVPGTMDVHLPQHLRRGGRGRSTDELRERRPVLPNDPRPPHGLRQRVRAQGPSGPGLPGRPHRRGLARRRHV
ncbi:hypothetical protein AOA80_03460 [Methanomassiliicoccales archaeon RumEn M1]|nr:hypothetical protein AOA80_03460 [Methanomassiliicoccales archaeon RumEn M1]